MSRDPQATQVHLLRHQRTELPPNKAQGKQFKKNKSRPKNMGYSNEDQHQAHYKKIDYENKKKFNPREILQSQDRCHKCGDCHKFGHFSSLCYKKQESYKKRPRSPKAYQLPSGRLSVQDRSMYRNTGESSSSEDESFCLQMKVQAKQANGKYQAPKHLFTNLEFKVKPHKNKTKFLWARIDGNIMPTRMYKYVFKDPDCAKIAPSDLQLGTYSNKKDKIIGSCNLYIVHPDTRCMEEIPFFVASNEGSILISCATSLALGLIKPHEKLDHLPPVGNRNFIYSSADKIMKRDEFQLNVHQLVRKPKLKTSKEAPIVCSRDGQLK